MKYFEAGLIIFAVMASGLLWVYTHHVFKRRFYQSAIARRISESCRACEDAHFFSTYIISRIVNLILKLPQKDQREIMDAFFCRDFAKAAYLLSLYDRALACGLEAHFDFCKIGNEIKNMGQLSSLDLLILSAFFAHIFDFESLRGALNQLQDLSLNKSENAWRNILQARLDLHDGDMNAASINAYAAVRKFNKDRQYREEADGYFLLGEIYRASALYDVAHMMYETAFKIFSVCDDPNGLAKVLAAEGMLLSGQERYQEAAAKFAESRKIYRSLKRKVNEAEVINQQALLHLLQKQYSLASKFAEQALKIHAQQANKAGQALSLDLMSIAAHRRKKYAQVLNYASQAQAYYLEDHNYSAYVEVMYLHAETLFMLHDYKGAEKLCHKILKTVSTQNTCFHLANAYALLGLISMAQKNYRRAKTLLTKSLDAELQNCRFVGIATDYSNLAKIENYCGKPKKALEYLHKALKAAQQAEDDELERIVRGQIKKIS